ncbi:isochorismate synthase [Pseudoalteromonas neustonica]|uniref:isochorismate synthase n=1 Tax=Pseudoalteromonas neustonica TaxID=1840331 RepID=A0ABU9U010_9GAMM
MYATHAFDSANSRSTLNFQSQYDCLFVSSKYCLASQGIADKFSIKIDDTAELVDSLRQKLAAYSDDTLAFGVLPFCKSEQAQFIIPKQVTRWDKGAFTACLNAELSVYKDPQNHLQSLRYLQSKQQFEHAVSHAKTLFNTEQLEKIVLSKQVDLCFKEAINKEQLLHDLLQQSQSGYHFSFPVSDESVLMGVSPELLLYKNDHQVLSNPLAGSIARHSCPNEELIRQQILLASNKDRFEHSVVIEDMEQVLTPFCNTLHTPLTPSLLSTATMWHLSTELTGTLHDANTHVLSIANQLHPTPALCGKPTTQAYPQIAALEGQSRGYFSGIIGWCDKYGNGEWVVVIRCAQIQKNTARLFAGAGIVAASVPHLEWQETEAKLNTMLNALGIQQSYYSLQKSYHYDN